jgi:hypothetical protein
MPDNEILKPIEGEITEVKDTIGEEIREAGRRGGVFIGTLNIMAEPARNYLTEPLASIYKSRYEQKFKNPRTVFLLDAGLVALGVLAAAAAIYFAFFFKAFQPVKLSFAILPNEPVSGGEIVINLEAQNNLTDIVSADIALRLPKTIAIKSSSVPFDHAKNTIHFDAIDPGAAADARLVADLSGPIGKKQKISGDISFTNARTGEKGKLSASASFNISRSLLNLSVELPAKMIVGQRFSGTFRYANKGGNDATGIFLTPNWPAGFTVASADTALKDGRYALGTIRAGAAGAFNWSGTLTDASAGSEFGAELDAQAGGEFIEEAVATANAPTIDPNISLEISGPGAGRTDDLLSYEVKYQNAGVLTLQNASLVLVSADGVAAETVGKIPAALEPGQGGVVAAEIRLPKTLPDPLALTANPALTFAFAVKGNIGEDKVEISSPDWSVKIASALGVTATARYYSAEGDQLGRGPLPPQVGKTTKYWIFWNITNTTNAASGVQVSATLPPNLDYTGKATVSTGDPLVFDPTTRTVGWNAGDVPPFPGSAADAVGAGFEVALTPSADQAGTYPILLSNIKITGTDSFAGLDLNAAAPDVNAKLAGDSKASGIGPVR